jgi:putative transposase
MKRKRYTEEQITAILKEHEAGMKTADLCRKHGISKGNFYSWKAKYGGLEVSEAKRLKELESENAKLKKLLVDAVLDNAALKDLLAKKGDAPWQARGCRSCTFRVRVERARPIPTAALRQHRAHACNHAQAHAHDRRRRERPKLDMLLHFCRCWREWE